MGGRAFGYSPILKRICTIQERFMSYVDKTDKCWIWNGALNPKGYGNFRANGFSSILAHRTSYELFVGKIPENLTIDHECLNRKCVNPDHLKPMSLIENQKKSPNFAANKTHCKRGHEFTKDNTYLNPTKPKIRSCRKCRGMYRKKYRSKKCRLI